MDFGARAIVYGLDALTRVPVQPRVIATALAGRTVMEKFRSEVKLRLAAAVRAASTASVHDDFVGSGRTGSERRSGDQDRGEQQVL